MSDAIARFADGSGKLYVAANDFDAVINTLQDLYEEFGHADICGDCRHTSCINRRQAFENAELLLMRNRFPVNYKLVSDLESQVFSHITRAMVGVHFTRQQASELKMLIDVHTHAIGDE